MNKNLTVLLLRLVLGALGGLVLWKFFYSDQSWWFAVIFGALVVIAAYASEAWRGRKK